MFRFLQSRVFKRAASLFRSFQRTNFGVIWCNPLIILTSYRAERAFPFYIMNCLARRFRSRPVHFICYICSYLPNGEALRLGKHALKQAHRRDDVKFHIMVNTELQVAQVESSGFRPVLCSSNALIDERIFTVGEEEKKWDALYDAQLIPIKRHHLATRVQNLVLIFPPVPWYLQRYARQVRQDLRQAEIANYSLNRQYRELSPLEVASVIRQTRVGLCLSRREGAMYACIQYLLAGIPVVSTHSYGGRERFLTSYNSLLVEDSPEAVADGVYKMKTRVIDPNRIRNEALRLVWEDRKNLFRFIESKLPASEIGYFEREWEQIFFNKWTVPDVAIFQIAQIVRQFEL